MLSTASTRVSQSALPEPMQHWIISLPASYSHPNNTQAVQSAVKFEQQYTHSDYSTSYTRSKAGCFSYFEHRYIQRTVQHYTAIRSTVSQPHEVRRWYLMENARIGHALTRNEGRSISVLRIGAIEQTRFSCDYHPSTVKQFIHVHSHAEQLAVVLG